MTTPMQSAMSLAEEHNLPVFPCRATDQTINGRVYKAKSPLTTAGFKDASRNLGQIEAWWTSHPDALIGVPTGAASGLYVIDVDPDGLDWYSENSARLAAGRIHKTKRGWHLLYRACGLGCSTKTLAAGVDTRGDGGYIVWWPASGLQAVGDLEDVGELPAWVMAHLRGAPQSDAGGDRSRDLLRKVSADVRAGLDDDEIINRHRDHPHARDQSDPERAIRRCITRARQEPHKGAEDAEPAGTSDDDLAQEFTRRYQAGARYIAAWGKWLLWDGRRWLVDDRLAHFSMARDVCRSVLVQLLPAADNDHKAERLRQRLGSAQTIAAVLRIAASDPTHALAVDQLDADPWVLNTPSGLLDLTTGALRPHDPAAHCTKIAAAAPTTECPAFMRTLERVIPDPEVREYLQRLAGYCLVGTVRDHVLPFWYGSGRNGKSVIANALRLALGDYATVLPAEVLMESHHDRHPTEIAVLRGVRLAVASEVDSGRRWNESRLKRLTGGDPISARYIGRDPFEFLPSHKLLVIANAKPGLRVIDDAIRGRIHLTNFGVVIPEAERDTALPERLTAEAGGILGWALAGGLEWLSGGLRPPAAVLAATGEYFDREDGIAQWITESCRPVGQITLSAAHRSYRAWCEANDMPAQGRNTFGDQLEARGYRRAEIRKRVFVYSGLSVAVREATRYAEG